MKKLFAILLTVALFATNAVIVMANDNVDTNEEHMPVVIVLPFPEFDFDWWFPSREFDSLIEELIFHRFGEGSEFLLPYVTEINQIFTAGQFEIEVIGAIAFEGRRRSQQVTHIYGEAFDEVVVEIEMFFVPNVVSNVFVAIRDLSGEQNMQDGVHLELARIFDEFGWPSPDGGWPQSLQVWRDTDRAYFAINQHHELEELPEQVDISFTLEYLLADFVWSSDIAGIDIADLLQNHEASFEAADYIYSNGEESPTISRWGWTTPVGTELLGDDFDPMAPDFGVLAIGELNIRLAEGFYLSNIALTDGAILRIQLAEPSHMAVRMGMGWTSIQLINRTHEEERNALWEESNRRWTEWFEAGYDWEDFDESWLWERLDEIDGQGLQELFVITSSDWLNVDAPHITETGYFIENLDLLDHLDFLVHKTYHGVHLPIPFSFSGVVPVHAFPTVEFPGIHRVFVHDRYLNLVNVAVSLMEISFDVQDTAFLFDRDYEGFFNAFDLFEIEIIMADGTILRDLWFGGSSLWGPIDGDDLHVSSITFSFFTDVRQVTGLRINGTEISIP